MIREIISTRDFTNSILRFVTTVTKCYTLIDTKSKLKGEYNERLPKSLRGQETNFNRNIINGIGIRNFYTYNL